MHSLQLLRGYGCAGLALSREFAGSVDVQDAVCPPRQIKLIDAFAAGFGVDTAARLIANPISEQGHQPVVAENRGSAKALIAAQAVTNAHTDGCASGDARDPCWELRRYH